MKNTTLYGAKLQSVVCKTTVKNRKKE